MNLFLLCSVLISTASASASVGQTYGSYPQASAYPSTSYPSYSNYPQSYHTQPTYNAYPPASVQQAQPTQQSYYPQTSTQPTQQSYAYPATQQTQQTQPAQQSYYAQPAVQSTYPAQPPVQPVQPVQQTQLVQPVAQPTDTQLTANPSAQPKSSFLSKMYNGVKNGPVFRALGDDLKYSVKRAAADSIRANLLHPEPAYGYGMQPRPYA